jgi:two-component system sensor histidine kinase HydH
MPDSHQKRPVRTPPTVSSAESEQPEALAPSSSPEVPGVRTRRVPSVLADIDDAAIGQDAFALQAQLDRLVEHFDLLHRQLREAQKLASLGATAAMIAHEFNNLFTPVIAYAEQALSTDDVDLMRKALTKTIEQTQVMRNMSDRVVGLAKQSDGAIKPINVGRIVHNAIECLGRDLSKDNIAVDLKIDPNLEVRANENQLLQVLFNLVINARQAMLGRRGRLTIDAAVIPDHRIEINVRDSGCGIPPENLGKIFDPFYSTKRDATKSDRRGLGLGLTICRDIIEEELDGQLDVSSEVDVGTVFTIVLPRAD